MKSVFAVKREQEFQDFAAKSAWIGNNHHLIHASRVPNFVGLLSRGLLLPKARRVASQLYLLCVCVCVCVPAEIDSVRLC